VVYRSSNHTAGTTKQIRIGVEIQNSQTSRILQKKKTNLAFVSYIHYITKLLKNVATRLTNVTTFGIQCELLKSVTYFYSEIQDSGSGREQHL